MEDEKGRGCDWEKMGKGEDLKMRHKQSKVAGGSGRKQYEKRKGKYENVRIVTGDQSTVSSLQPGIGESENAGRWEGRI